MPKGNWISKVFKFSLASIVSKIVLLFFYKMEFFVWKVRWCCERIKIKKTARKWLRSFFAQHCFEVFGLLVMKYRHLLCENVFFSGLRYTHIAIKFRTRKVYKTLIQTRRWYVYQQLYCNTMCFFLNKWNERNFSNVEKRICGFFPAS